MEMDLAVDGGLGRIEGCDYSAPHSGSKTGEPKSLEEGKSPGVARPSLCPHSRLKAGVSGEQEHSNGDLHRGRNEPYHTHLRPRCLPVAPLLWLPVTGWTLIPSLPLAGPDEAIEMH